MSDMSASSQQEHEFRAGGRAGRGGGGGYGRGSGNYRRNSFKNSAVNSSGENRRRSDDIEGGAGGTERKTIGNATDETKEAAPVKVDPSRARRGARSPESAENTSPQQSDHFTYENHQRRNVDAQQLRGGGGGGGGGARRGSGVGRFSRGDHRSSRRPRAVEGRGRGGENGRRSYDRQNAPPSKANDVTANSSGEKRDNESTAQVQGQKNIGFSASSSNFDLKEIVPANAEEEKRMLRIALEQSQLLEDERRAMIAANRALEELNFDETEKIFKKQLAREDFPPLSSSFTSRAQLSEDSVEPSSSVLVPEGDGKPSAANSVSHFERDVNSKKKIPDNGATSPPERPTPPPPQDWNRLGAKPKGTVSISPHPSTAHLRHTSPAIGRGSGGVTNHRALGTFLKASGVASTTSPPQQQQQQQQQQRVHEEQSARIEGQFSDRCAETISVVRSNNKGRLVEPNAPSFEDVPHYEPQVSIEPPPPPPPPVLVAVTAAASMAAMQKREERDNCSVPKVRDVRTLDATTPMYVSQLEARNATEEMQRISGEQLLIDRNTAELIECSEEIVNPLMDGSISPVHVYDSKQLTLPDHHRLHPQVVYGFTDVRLMEQQRHLDEQSSVLHHHQQVQQQQQQQQQQHMLGGISQILFCPIPGGGGYPIGVTYPLMRPSFQPVVTVTPDGQFIQTSQHSAIPFDFAHLINRLQEYPDGGQNQQSDLQEHHQQQRESPVEIYQSLPVSGEGSALLPTPPTPVFLHSQLSADALPFSPRHNPAERGGYQSYYNNGRAKPRRSGGSGSRYSRNFSSSRGYHRSNEENVRPSAGMSPSQQQQTFRPRGQYNQSQFHGVPQHVRNYQNQDQYDMVPPPPRHQQTEVDSQQQQQQPQQLHFNHLYSGLSFNAFPHQHPTQRRYRSPYQE